MDIAGYIKEFLLIQNNVRVPGLGSFFITSQSASIDDNKKTITPPSKAIVFDTVENTDDLLFVKYLSGEEGISEKAAQQAVTQFVAEVKSNLKSDGFVTFPGFGKFSYDNKQQIQFKPNLAEILSAETYGLETLTDITPLKEPVSKISAEKEITKAKEPEPKPVPVSTPAEEEQPESAEGNTKKNHFTRVLIFSLIPLILVCAGIIWAINMGYVSNAKFDFSKVHFDFASLFLKKTPPVAKKPIVLGPKTVDSSKVANNGVDSMNAQQKALFYHEDETQGNAPAQPKQKQNVQKSQPETAPQKKEVKKENKEIKKETTQEPTKVAEKAPSKVKTATGEASGRKYYIIAGSFKKLSFAQNLKKELEKNGFHVEILTVDKQTFRVALGSYKSKDSANKELNKLKALKNSDTYWLYSK